ncbi:type IV leader peptidase family protein [Amycolatopsis echigonensis]|uniref:Type IV leader peptidase family protein n=1 Tax=Amycolatopsis echigonensis TaxID=2576905 RepID=A0A2N3W917_9PSEU|nr:A24 family peptidase [Amycolatopsis niigatensis]PKV90364.1 type IV leader peptidase family protein [Amycolatopsis niigatensis]
MVLTAVLAAGAVVPVLLVMTKKAGAPVSAVLGMTTAVAAVAVAAARADSGALPAWWLPVAWLVSVLGVPLALADVRHRRLPDVLTLPAYPVVALTLALAALSGGGWRLAAGAALGCLLFGGTHLIVHRLSAGGLGPGDVKLAGSFGAVLGAVGGLAPAVAAVLAAMVSAAAMVPMWLMRRIRQARGSRTSARLPATETGALSLRSESREELPNAIPADGARVPAPTGTDPSPTVAATVPHTGPVHSRIRAGPLRVPYGPGLVLATWACAVFPAAGTGIA